MLPLFSAGACRALEAGPVDSTALQYRGGEPILRIEVLADSADPRLPSVREAVAHWNDELRRLGRRVQLDSVRVRPNRIADDVVAAASPEAPFDGGPSTNRLLSKLDADTADIVVILTHSPLISFSVQWRKGSKGVVGIRTSDIPPLSLPNTVRNVVAHETGHVLGLSHNTDSTTLMCGRPSPCRPAAFASDQPRFFPLTTADEQRIRARWP